MHSWPSVKNRDCSSYGFPTGYDPTVWSRLVRTVQDVRDDSSTILVTVLQDVTTVALRLPTFCMRCRYDLAASRLRRQLNMNLNCIVVCTYLPLTI